jgi:hypothetical protein
MSVPYFGWLQRFTSRVRGAVAKSSESTEAETLHRRVPGRQEATEAAFGRWQASTFSTPTILGLSLVAAIFLVWYYTHAYTPAHRVGGNNASRAAEATDTPLPPLQRAAVSKPPIAKADPHSYLIGDILAPDEDASPEPPALGMKGEGEGAAATAYPRSGASHRDRSDGPQARRLEGAVFTRRMSAAQIVESTGADGHEKPTNAGEGANAETSSIDHL